MNRLIIVGASGHGRVVADIARLTGYTDIVFLDNNSKLKECAGYPVLGPDRMAEELEGELFIAVGNAAIRERLMLNNAGRHFPVLIHPAATIARDSVIGAGTVTMAGSVVNPGARIGAGCIVNTCASVDHDCVLQDYVHISPGAHLAGAVTVGKATWIGAGTTIINNVDICGNCLIGVGAVVIRSIEQPGTYVGVPARMIKPAPQ